MDKTCVTAFSPDHIRKNRAADTARAKAAADATKAAARG
eukprot:gene3699-19467_t